MKSFIALALLSISLKTCQGSHDGHLTNSGALSKGNVNADKLPLLFLKRFYDGLSYDGFVGLMGRRMAGAKEIPGAQKRDMNDFFVSLMGRRNLEYDTSTTLNKDISERKGPRTPSKH
ncbi:tachykinin-3-like isoform X1 [Scyliorhinus canicula]|uniref:tachykinin-3-like isoform X1 n=1 Tax=Scyliorhinus canicula TaxID=7830 RepID=UPI0018F78BC0|nr:tachykinin-3-like isoform X1 [Scyliorhinus canicula]XP_038642540.1 tachykinin-3-like isoform X1 [Scyliorhinus canicula]